MRYVLSYTLMLYICLLYTSPETMMSGRAVNGYAVYCFYFFDGYHICKSVVSDGVRVLGLNVEMCIRDRTIPI